MINSIQVLRGLAILLVIFYHVTAMTPMLKAEYYFEIGRIGVDIFFIISGYIMSLILERHEPARKFMLKRIIRIMPLFLIVTFLAVIANYLPRLINNDAFVIESLVKSVFLIPHFSIANPEKVFPIFIPGWTITYEMWFYVSIGLILLFTRSVNHLLIVFLLLVVFTISCLVPSASAINQFLSNSVYLCFALGIVFRLFEKKKIDLGKTILIIGIVFSIALFLEGSDSRLITLGFPSFIIFVAGFYLIGERFSVIAFVGKISFSLYLTHVFTINVVEKFFAKLFGHLPYYNEVLIFSAVSLSLLIAYFTYELFESRLDFYLRKRFIK